MDLGQQLRDARKKAKLTQAQLAEQVGLATITIRQYELGKRKLTIETVQKLASALGVPAIDLLGPYEGPPLPNLVDGNKTDEVNRREDLLRYFGKLNDKGQEMVVDVVAGLAGNPEFRK